LQNDHLLPPLFSFLSTMGGGGGEEGCVGGQAGHRRGGGDRGEGEPPSEEGRGGRWRSCTGRKNKENLGTRMVEAHRIRRPSPEPNTKSSIGDEPSMGSTNRRHQDEALNKTNVAVPSDSAENARIKSNCSPELSPKLEPPPNFGKRFREFQIESEGGVSNFGKGSMRGFQPYILLGFEDLLFFVIILFLKLKNHFQKRLKSFSLSEKYLKGSKNSRKFLDMIWHPMNSKNIFITFENVFKYLK
jgi:hypothetical protein